jgi:cobyrinic acid a,c-diamide synthase
MAALARRGLRVAAFKVGPDFIDPGHHARITGSPSRNLDGWMLSRPYNLEAFRKSAAAADIAVVEGVMGLYDGYDGKTEDGSSAQMAKWLGLPVLLVVDARGMARSAAALVQGFENFDPAVRFAGVMFNRLGSPRHLGYLQEAVEGAVRMPCLGGMRREEALAIPERHLGLVTREEHFLEDAAIARLAERIEGGMDVGRLLTGMPEITGPAAPTPAPGPRPSGRVRIGVARDPAFCFYYPDNLELLETCGARLVFFSPLREADLPPDLDGIYFGGGYPELFAEELSANTTLRTRIREKSLEGMPVYAECGGFMYLCTDLQGGNGRRFPMAGCFPFATRMLPRLKALGYREVCLSRDVVLGRRGAVMRGHEFHYSEIVEPLPPAQTAYRVAGRAGMERTLEGYVSRRTLGSYIHLHWGSEPQAADAFVQACRSYRNERNSAHATA